jgi:putative ABC transport system substrate-binding protein
MLRRAFVLSAIGALAGVALGQPSGVAKPLRIGILSLRPRESNNPNNVALFDGLHDAGYVDGRNLAIEYPDAQEREDRLPALAIELVRRNVDLILVTGPAPLSAARKATTSIPIVMVASSADPVREGVATSLARPGGNVTGLTYAEPDRFKKQLELLKSVAGHVVRVGVLWDWDFDLEAYRRDWEQPLNDAARRLRMAVLEPILVREEQGLPAAVDALKQQNADAFVVSAASFMFPARGKLADLALRARLPGIAAFKVFPEAGLLLSYGPDIAAINRRAASYVDRIAKGARAADLPIELPSKFDLGINMKTATALGLAVDPSVLVRATDVYR